MNSEVLKSAGVFLGGVLATITPYLVSWIKKKFDKSNEGKAFLDNAEHRIKINEILVEIRALTGANRVALVEYHNGNSTITGLPFNYASMTYERTDQTTREMMRNFQKIPISPICELLLDVQNSEHGYIRVDAIYKHQEVVKFNKYHGVEVEYVYRINDNVKYGTLHVMWINTEPLLSVDQQQEIYYKVMYLNELMLKMKKY